MAKVKICGLQDEAMVRVAAEAGADWVGFVLAPKSPRNVLGDGAGAFDRVVDLMFAASDMDIRCAVLLANANEQLLNGLIEAAMPDVIQLHGRETPDFVSKLRYQVPDEVEIWKAFGVEAAEDLEAVFDYPDADRLLLDARPPKNADRAGGHGHTFDWSILEDWDAPKPWLLAGGLTPGNVEEAITATGAPAVDVSSGVERARGVKDEDLIRDFIAAAKSAD